MFSVVGAGWPAVKSALAVRVRKAGSATRGFQQGGEEVAVAGYPV
jgi:hypothetical protein